MCFPFFFLGVFMPLDFCCLYIPCIFFQCITFSDGDDDDDNKSNNILVHTYKDMHCHYLVF